MELRATNVNQALAMGLHWLKVAGIKDSSRNGPVIVSPEPVMTIYHRPTERVLFSPLRDANPFFHLMEALWMLAGRCDVHWPAYFNSRFAQYSDDGEVTHGAYGYRWRKEFGFDQLAVIAKELKNNPLSRRAVLAMWDAHKESEDDLNYAVFPGTRDAPCNTHIYFDCCEGQLNMNVLCRSNDIWWGAYGANAVHFSILQEFLATWIGLPVGLYRQFSNNFHLYTEVVAENRLTEFAADAENNDVYSNRADVIPFPLITVPIEIWQEELAMFMSKPAGYMPWMYRDPFFAKVAVPMYAAWHLRKQKKGTGLEFAEQIAASDWRWACTQWILRRELKKHDAA